MKLQHTLTQLKSGLKSKPILILLVIIVVLIFLNIMQSCSAKKNYADLSLKKSELMQCQQVNKENKENVDEVINELDRCVGIKQEMELKIISAKIELKEFKQTNKAKLNETIKKLESLPAQNCDDVVIDHDAVLMWVDKTDSKD